MVAGSLSRQHYLAQGTRKNDLYHSSLADLKPVSVFLGGEYDAVATTSYASGFLWIAGFRVHIIDLEYWFSVSTKMSIVRPYRIGKLFLAKP